MSAVARFPPSPSRLCPADRTDKQRLTTLMSGRGLASKDANDADSGRFPDPEQGAVVVLLGTRLTSDVLTSEEIEYH